MGLALNIIYLIICIALIGIVLMQSGKQAGLSGSIAGGAETFFGKTKARTMDAMLGRLTTVCAVLFMVLAIVLHFVL
ncbi:MAG: preprotein translocase subunit SecG [Clostridia bacterium]|nr:preprotein translocase subunit SecG [Clostridia bacterium]